MNGEWFEVAGRMLDRGETLPPAREQLEAQLGEPGQLRAFAAETYGVAVQTRDVYVVVTDERRITHEEIGAVNRVNDRPLADWPAGTIYLARVSFMLGNPSRKTFHLIASPVPWNETMVGEYKAGLKSADLGAILNDEAS